MGGGQTANPSRGVRDNFDGNLNLVSTVVLAAFQ